MKKSFSQSKAKRKFTFSFFNEYWTKQNYVFLVIGILVLILGYYLMSFSPWFNVISMNISPIVLLVGYLILLPLSIFFRFNKKQNDSGNS